MKASEMIDILQQAIAKKGDVEVRLYGAYGAESDEFSHTDDSDIRKNERHLIWIYTGINTG